MDTKVATIRFFVAEKRLAREGDPWPDSRFPLAEVVEKLDELTGTERYSHQSGREVLAHVRYPGNTKKPAHLVFYRIRRDQLPDQELGGEISPLELDEDAGLAEPTEFMFFEGNVVGMLFNQFGPSSTAAAVHLENRLGIDATFLPLLRPDILDQLAADDSVSMVDIRVASGNLDALAQGSQSLRDGARRVQAVGDVGSIELLIRPPRGQKQKFWDTWRPVLENLIKGTDSGDLEKVQATRQHPAFPERDETVNLLADKLTVEWEVQLQERSRHVSPQAAATAITQAFNEHRGEIAAAIELRG